MLKSIKNLLPSKIKTDVVPIKHTTEDANVQNEEKKKTKGTNLKDEKSKNKKGNVMMFMNCNGIHIGNVKHINYTTKSIRNNTVNIVKPNDEKKEQKKSSPEIPEEIRTNFDNITMVEYSDFNLVKNIVNNLNKFRETFCPYDDSNFNYLSEEEVVLLILQRWTQANGRYATIGILCSDLWEIGEIKAAHKLAQAHL